LLDVFLQLVIFWGVCRAAQVGGICREESLQCFSSASRMAWLAPCHNWSHWRWGKIFFLLYV